MLTVRGNGCCGGMIEKGFGSKESSGAAGGTLKQSTASNITVIMFVATRSEQMRRSHRYPRQDSGMIESG